jgi:hypothetical protein
MATQPVKDLELFCLLLAASWLVNPSEIRKLREEFGQVDPNGSLDGFTTFLEAKGRVTVWQIDLLRKQKYKGFFLDCFVLLDRLEYRDDHTRFLARNTTTQHRLILCVKPPTADGADQYWTEELP